MTHAAPLPGSRVTDMRSLAIVTNETCNHACSFCDARRPVERAGVAAAAAVRLRIDEAASAAELVLTGGEPTLRRDLPLLVAHAKRHGARVVLETNGSLLDEARVRKLAAARLDEVRVHLPAWGDEADAIARDPGAFERTRRALHAIAAAGLGLELATPVVRANLDSLARLPRALAAEGRALLAALRGIAVRVPTSAPAPETLAPLPRAAIAIAALCEAARSEGVAVRMAQQGFLPPCSFPAPARVAHLYALSPGGADRPDHVRVAACQSCEVRRSCPGMPRAALAHDPTLRVAPIRDDRTRRRLTLISTVEAQVARELVTRDVRRMADGSTMRENIVRVNFHCNQSCRFCFVSTHLPTASDTAIEEAVTEIGAIGGILTLSGGEPTLNPRLPELVRLGRARGARIVELQTNAIRLAEPGYAETLASAGVDVCFVSLHGADAPTSDAITGAPGTFDRTVAGIDSIQDTAMTLRLNYVFCRRNLGHFRRYVELVARRWSRASITVSFVAASTDVVPFDHELVPRYSDIMPDLTAGLESARALGVEVSGYESMCGVPLCLLPVDTAPYFAFAPAPEDGGEFLKTDVCQRCALGDRCFGIRRGYATLHGTDELRAVAHATERT